MVAIALSFAVGAWWVQQQAELIPPIYGLGVLLFVCTMALTGWRFCVAGHRFCHHAAVKPLGLSALGLMAGISWATGWAHYRLNEALPPQWQQTDIQLIGVIASLPESTERGVRFVMEVERVLTPQATVPHRISLSYYPNTDSARLALPANDAQAALNASHFRAGERWQLTVRLKRPHTTYNPHGYDYEAWLLSEGIRATGNVRAKRDMLKQADLVWRPSYVVNRWREHIGNRIDKTLTHQPFAGVIRALVIGDDSQIQAQDWQVYLRTGTNHLMSISGLHITMLSGMVFALVYWGWRNVPRLAVQLPARKAASVLGMLTALVYAALAGFSVPTQRTLFMLVTVSMLLLSGRQFSLAKVVAVALLVVVIIDPWAVNAPGFWLSFGAVAVMAFAMGARLASPHWLWSAAKVQWAVTLGLVPALIWMFGQASMVSPLANAIAIPVISFAVVPLSLSGSILPIDAVLPWAHAILAFCMQVLHAIATWPWAVWQQAAPAPWAVGLAILGAIWMLMPRGIPLRTLGAVCALPMLFPGWPALQTGELKLSVLDVGQGLSVVVQTASHALLYDAGARYSATSDAGQRIVVPYLRGVGISRLDGVVISHDDNDHAGGMPSVFAQLPVGWMASSIRDDVGLMQSPLWTSVLPQERMWCYAGQEWHWDAVKFEVLWPRLTSYEYDSQKDNNRSCVIKITSQNGRVLLTGDIEQAAELGLLSDGQDLKSEIMVAPHHGSKTSSSQDFLRAVAPHHVLVTNGYLNRFGHPKANVLARYQALPAQVYRSDYDGAVLFTLGHDKIMAVNRWRKSQRKYWHDDYSRISED